MFNITDGVGTKEWLASTKNMVITGYLGNVQIVTPAESGNEPLPFIDESTKESGAVELHRDETLGRMLNTPPKPRT